MKYRDKALESVARAKEELSTDSDHRLRYATLELRMSLEALIYEKASQYSEELSNKKLSTWQPKKLLNLLLEIDPTADKSASISIGKEDEYGKPAKIMTTLGKDRILSLREIKKYYDRLGSYLHTQTIDQFSEGKGPTPSKMRARCNEIIEIIDEVLASPVFNTNFKVTSSISCRNCGSKIVRRIPHESKTLIAKCMECPATYTLTVIDENKNEWKPNNQSIPCANQSCLSPMDIWQKEIIFGSHWKCQKCKGINTFVPAVSYEAYNEENVTEG